MTTSPPSFAQIRHVKHLLSTDLFGPATIARLSGVPLRDVLRITKSTLPTIFDGNCRPAALRQIGTE